MGEEDKMSQDRKAGQKPGFVSFDSADLGNLGVFLDGIIGAIIRNNTQLDQELVELRAGKEYIKAPKVRTFIFDELVATPIMSIAANPPSEAVRDSASQFIEWYAKAIGRNRP